MSCERVQHTLAVLADPDVAEAILDAALGHLDGCPACQQAEAALLDDDLFGTLATVPPPAELADDVLDSVFADMDADFDARFAGLLDIAPPADLVSATLDRLTAEMAGEADEPPVVIDLAAARRQRRRRLGGLASALAVAAALVLVLFPPQDPVGDVSTMIEKGGDGAERLPTLAVDVAVKRDGQRYRRYRVGERYTVGDMLNFRARVDAPSEAILARVDARGATVVHRQPMAADTAEDFTWEIEAGEGTAAFVLLAAPIGAEGAGAEVALDDALVEAMLSSAAAGLQGSCAAVEGKLPASCAAVVVEVAP